MEQNHHHGNSESELAIDRQLQTVVVMNLFEEQPPYLNSFFRFQLGSNTFDGMSLRMMYDLILCVVIDTNILMSVYTHPCTHTFTRTHTPTYEHM